MDAVAPEELRQAAYRYAARIAERPWDFGEVKRSSTRILAYLAEAGLADRCAFELRVATLEEQTVNLGLDPRHWQGTARPRRRPIRRDIAERPSPEELVTQARRILDWITER